MAGMARSIKDRLDSLNLESDDAPDNAIKPGEDGQDEKKPRRRGFKHLKGAHEFKLHIAAAKWLDAYPGTAGRWYHSPNGFYRTRRTAFWCRLAGVKPGIPDVHIPIPCVIGTRVFTALWIEFKRPRVGKRGKPLTPRISPTQRIWRDILTSDGQAAWHIITTIDDLATLCTQAYPVDRPIPLLVASYRERIEALESWVRDDAYRYASTSDLSRRSGMCRGVVDRIKREAEMNAPG